MLDEPRINFAISTRGNKLGVDHLGIQVDSAAELIELKSRAQSADMSLMDEGKTTCCYAQSDKHWLVDPQGIAWEQFHTLQDIPVFSQADEAKTEAACCVATVPARPAVISIQPAPRQGCC
jgi:hypothetical protein